MRLSDETRFPHPVLSPFSDDYLEGEFDVEFTIDETPATGALSLTYQVKVTDAAMAQLVNNGQATAGCFISCPDTYYNMLHSLSWPTGRLDFVPGSLLNGVVVRPVIFANDNIPKWDTGTINSEFDLPVDLLKDDLLALGEEHTFSVGQAKLAEIESIFELDFSDEVADGVIRVNLDADRITITTSRKTFDVIDLLRGQANGAPIVMNAVYLPAVMETLNELIREPGQYQGRRWYTPFAARCDVTGVKIEDASLSILDAAQTLLESPIERLDELSVIGEEE